MQTTDRDFCKMSLYTYIIADFVEKSRRGEGAKASLEKGGGPAKLVEGFWWNLFLEL